jgi:hypothetical protein
VSQDETASHEIAKIAETAKRLPELKLNRTTEAPGHDENQGQQADF